jgi:hypothetical protein
MTLDLHAEAAARLLRLKDRTEAGTYTEPSYRPTSIRIDTS